MEHRWVRVAREAAPDPSKGAQHGHHIWIGKLFVVSPLLSQMQWSVECNAQESGSKDKVCSIVKTKSLIHR